MSDLAARVTAGTDDILSGIRSNTLQLNADETELIWCATFEAASPVSGHLAQSWFKTMQFTPSTVRNLGVCIDADRSMRTYVQRTVAGRFASSDP